MSGLQPPISMWPAAEGCDPVDAGDTADVVTSSAAGILHFEAKVCCLCLGMVCGQSGGTTAGQACDVQNPIAAYYDTAVSWRSTGHFLTLQLMAVRQA